MAAAGRVGRPSAGRPSRRAEPAALELARLLRGAAGKKADEPDAGPLLSLQQASEKAEIEAIRAARAKAEAMGEDPGDTSTLAD